MSVLVVPKLTAQALRELTGESRPDAALMLVMQDARSYRLEQITASLAALEAKYGMTFEEYRERWETRRSGRRLPVGCRAGFPVVGGAHDATAAT